MSFFWIAAYTVICAALGYMLGRSDGQVEGRIESNQRHGGWPSASKSSEPR